MTTSIKLSNLISPAFYDAHSAIKAGEINELVAKGGRGSTKSSFISIELIKLLLQTENCHAAVLRKVGNTLRKSVYAQIIWAISALGLYSKFRCTVSPMEITYIPTGQTIMFFGLDDPGKLKSIKLPFGYIGIAWFEELDQFAGPEEIRSVEQSVFRGGPFSFSFKSFNPPAMSRNWANRYALKTKPRQLVHHSSYLTTPQDWLGPRFLEDAEYMKAQNETKYRHEYLGEIVGNGTQVFDNLRLETISATKIKTFNEIASGVDWGWYPDPWAFNRTSYDAGRRILYIFDELRCNKTSNAETAKLVKQRIASDELVTADSSEEKSCDDYRSYGIHCRAAEKGPGSIKRSMKWLQGLSAIVIDPVQCPETTTEFSEYEYETGKDGEVLQGFLDINNHNIDATRYGTERIWKKRGAQ
ncbi:MAG: PBSX family phage terminase large subunit [Oscillospiraceae bacterium]